MSNEDESRGLNILCIDGGGARGLSSLIILREIMNRLNGLGDGNGELKPADCFDVIAGSGTGGLSACMLGRLRMPLDSAIEEYAKLIQDVFADKKIIRTNGPSAYKGSKLREVLQQIVSKFGKYGETMEEVGSPEDCKTIIFAMSKHNINAALPSMFRSYRVVANRGPDCSISDALCATMAHPDLFKDIEIKEGALRQSFISSDLGCSNPMAHVLAEVKRVYPGRHVSCILSIGAGHARTINIPDHGIPEQIFRTQDLAAMKDMATDSERVAEEMAIRFGSTNKVYFRFNVDQGIQDMKAGDWERLQDVIAHTKAYLFKIDTDQRIEDLVQVIKKQSDSLEVELIDGQVQQRLRVRRPPRLRKCPAPTPVYTGRKDEAKQVIGCLLANGDECPICVIYGLGGSGKTQLALKVVEQTRNNWIEVLYIDGTSRETIESALEAFAGVKNIGHTYQDSIDWLESCLGRWLMIFDNVDEPSIGANLRRYLPAGTYGSVLITTRLTDLTFLARGAGSVCRMSPGMKPEESFALLTKVARLLDHCLPEPEMKAAIALMEDFGHLALAIVHAGAYLAHSPGLTISKYRTLFHAQRRRMLEEYSKLKVSVDDYTKTVYTTWEMCYSLLKQDTRPMLWLLAFLHHNSITEQIFERATINTQNPLARVSLLPPTETTTSAYHHVDKYLRQFLDPTGGWDGLQFLNVINEVVSYSLIDFDRMNDAYSIHILVQDWAKTKVEQEQELALECTATLLSLSIGFESSDDSPESKEFMVSLEMHLDCFLANRQITTRDYHRQFAKVYRELKRWQQVEDLEVKLYQEMNRALGEKHMYTLGCMIDLASTYLTQDLLDKAEELQRKVLDTQRELLGQDHPHTQRSITNLASIYLKQGRWDEAEKVQLLGLNSDVHLQPQSFRRPSQEVTHFQSSPGQQDLISEREFLNMLRGKANLALVYSNRGRLVEAEALQNEVLNAYQGKFTEEHSDTVTSMLNLISTYCQQNRWDESAKLCLRVVELQTRMFGEADPDTLKSMAKLAMIYSKQGQWAKAETSQQHVVNSYGQALGLEHPDTLKAMAELAVILSKQDDWAEAETLQHHVVKSYQQDLGPDHVDTLKAMSGLALIYSRQGIWTKAEILQRHVVKSYEGTFGATSPDTLKAMSKLAVIHSKQGHWTAASSLQESVLNAYFESPGIVHRDMVTVLAGLAVTQSRIRHGRQDQVIRLLSRCWERFKNDLDKHNTGNQISVVKYGVLNLGCGHLAKEEELGGRILDLNVRFLGEHMYNLDTVSDIEISILTLGYLEAYAWFLCNPKPSRFGLLDLSYIIPWAYFKYYQLAEAASPGWLEYLCGWCELWFGIPILCDDEIYRQISDIYPNRKPHPRKKQVEVLLRSVRADVNKDVPAGIPVGRKSLNMAGSMQGAGSYSPPIGIIRLWIKCAKDVKNVEATLGGKSDPYVRVMLNAVTMARTEVKNNNLNPEWGQIVYVPVHSLRETLYLECMGYQRLTKDRSLGFVELSVAELARQTEDERVPYEGTGKRDVADPIRLGKGQTKGELHYTAEFIPALALQGVSFRSVDNIQRTIDSAKGQTAATNTEKGELDDETPLEEHKTDGVQMSTEELLSKQSGVLVFNIIDGHIAKKARLEVLLDDGYWPVFATEKARSTQAHWDQVGEGFIKELDFGRVWLRLNENDEGEKEDIIAEFKLDAKQFLEEALAGPTTFNLSGQDGKNASTIRIQAKYVPVEIKLDPRESINNVGVLHVELVDGREIHGADRSGKSDPFVVFYLNGSKVFKSQTKKKTLTPEWKESFDISIPSRVGADFSLEVFDWNQVEAAKSLGSGQVELSDLVPLEVTVREIALSSEKHGENGIIQIYMVFRPKIIVKSRAKTSTFPSAGHVVGRKGRKVGGHSGRDGDIPEDLPEVSPLAPIAEADPAANGNGAATGRAGSTSGLAVKPPPSPTPGPGILKVTLHWAKVLTGIKEGDVAKLYVILRIEDKSHKSSHVKSNTPEWNESFTFPNTSTEIRTLHVAVMDKKTFAKDPILAEGTIDIWQHIQPLFTPPILSKEITVLLEDNSGTLHLRLEFDPIQNTLAHTTSTAGGSSLTVSKKTPSRSRLGFNNRWREKIITPQ